MHEVQVKGILSAQNGMNVYRGCSHGCIYCDARSKCYGITHPFEDIEVKANAPELLAEALRSKRHKVMVGTGSMCDPYIHAEERILLTRRCLEVINEYGCGVSILTKSSRVLRDLDILVEINNKSKAVVAMTLTTYNDELCRIIEPNVSTTSERFETLLRLKEAGIPTIVWIDPILPFINDTEENIRGILDYCVRAGVKGIVTFGIGLTLREGNREYFFNALDKSFPGLKEQYLASYGYSYSLPSPNERRLMSIITQTCKDNGIMYKPEQCFDYTHKFPEQYIQLSLFD